MVDIRVIGDRGNKGIREKVVVNRVMNHKKKKGKMPSIISTFYVP